MTIGKSLTMTKTNGSKNFKKKTNSQTGNIPPLGSLLNFGERRYYLCWISRRAKLGSL